MKLHKDGTAGGDIFVFGSNLRGRHGAGAALEAVKRYGAIEGLTTGRMGMSYAIPTKDQDMRPCPRGFIKARVKDFIAYAKEHPELEFFVTRVGCGLAGYSNADIAPLFRKASSNCSFAEDWEVYLDI